MIAPIDGLVLVVRHPEPEFLVVGADVGRRRADGGELELEVAWSLQGHPALKGCSAATRRQNDRRLGLQALDPLGVAIVCGDELLDIQRPCCGSMGPWME